MNLQLVMQLWAQGLLDGGGIEEGRRIGVLRRDNNSIWHGGCHVQRKEQRAEMRSELTALNSHNICDKGKKHVTPPNCSQN